MIRPTLAFALFCACLTALASHPSQAQSAADVQRPSLDQELAQAQQPDDGQVAIAVGASKITMPDGAPDLGPSPNLPTIAADYGRILLDFGAVTAIAPPTMVVINTAPSSPNILAGMSRGAALAILTAGLTDSQWQEFTSDTGLPISELTTPIQKELLSDQLPPDGELIARPEDEFGREGTTGDYHTGAPTDITASLAESSIRLGRFIEFHVSPAADPNQYGASLVSLRLSSSPHYELDGADLPSNSRDSVYGVKVRAVVTNVPKSSQLDYDTKAMQGRVSLEGLKDLGDLIARISAETHTEIYADSRIEGQSLTVIGHGPARAGDLLQAVAYCVTGTFRQVGPAYVLTDDVVGIGTRTQLWEDFEQATRSLAKAPEMAAVDKVDAHHSPNDLSWFGEPIGFSPAQIAATYKELMDDPKSSPNYTPWYSGPFSDLTPGQQAMLSRGVSDWNARIANTQGEPDSPDEYPELSTAGTLTLFSGLALQLIVPGLPGPVDLSEDTSSALETILFNDEWTRLSSVLNAQNTPKTQVKPVPEAQPVMTVLQAAKLRAVIVHPLTDVGVRADIAAMKRLNLNEMWIDVFSNGVTHIAGSPLSSLPQPLKPAENDILAEALTDAPKAGIRVYAIMDLLFWGANPPADCCDLNILGETSAESAARRRQVESQLPKGQVLSDVYTSRIVPDYPGVAVTSINPTVRNALTALVTKVASMKGISGIVWRWTDPPGYDIPGNPIDTSNLLLGYTPAMRLAFLRKSHSDPVDVYPTKFNLGQADTSLPNFDDGDAGQTLDEEWIEFRRQTNLDFLRALYSSAQAAMPTGQHLPILIKQRRNGDPDVDDATGAITFTPGWYGSWDNPSSSPPAFDEWNPVYQDRNQAIDEYVQARSQSRQVLAPFGVNRLETDGAEPTTLLKEVTGPNFDGFVLDLSDDPFIDDGGANNPLTRLADSAKPAP